MRKMLSRTFVCCLVAVAAALAGGCKTRMPVLEYPDFYGPELQTVAVAPFRGEGGGGHPGRMVSYKFAEALAVNGTYDVVGPANLPSPQRYFPPSIQNDDDVQKVLDELRARGGVDAVIIGSVEAFATESYNTYYPTRRYHPSYSLHPYYYRHGWGYGLGYEYDWRVRNEADVGVWAVMVRISDGEVIHTTPGLVAGSGVESGYYDGADTYAALNEAVDDVVQRLLDEFAVVQKQIEIDPERTLLLGRPVVTGGVQKTDKFELHDEMIALLHLPEAAAGNTVRLVVWPDDSDVEVAARTVTWKRGQDEVEVTFSPREIATEYGPGEYEMRLYSLDEEVLEREFEIVGKMQPQHESTTPPDDVNATKTNPTMETEFWREPEPAAASHERKPEADDGVLRPAD
jgi:hypothetical protein